MNRRTIGALAGLAVGAVFGYVLFNDADNALLGTWIPTLIFAVAAAFVGYYLVKLSGSSQTADTSGSASARPEQ